MSTSAMFHEFKITATYKGDKPWDNEGGRYPANYNNHVVTVTNTETGARTSFEFWASIMNPEVRTHKDVLGAFWCFLADALDGLNYADEWDFFDNMGYTPSKRAHDIYKAVKRSGRKALRVIGNEARIRELLNEIDN